MIDHKEFTVVVSRMKLPVGQVSMNSTNLSVKFIILARRYALEVNP